MIYNMLIIINSFVYMFVYDAKIWIFSKKAKFWKK